MSQKFPPRMFITIDNDDADLGPIYLASPERDDQVDRDAVTHVAVYKLVEIQTLKRQVVVKRTRKIR